MSHRQTATQATKMVMKNVFSWTAKEVGATIFRENGSPSKHGEHVFPLSAANFCPVRVESLGLFMFDYFF